MKTSKPFSTISYNTKSFLQLKLDDLIKRRVLTFYAFIYHYKEDDERKDHIHIYFVPNGQYQTDQLHDYLSELDLNDLTNKPLGIMPIQSSKWDDWFLYSSHDVAYLATKGQSRKYHYLESDFITSDADYLHEIIRTIDRTKYVKTLDFVEKIKNGANLSDLVLSGQVPAPQFSQWKQMYDFVKYDQTFRPGLSHTPSINEDGEVLDD